MAKEVDRLAIFEFDPDEIDREWVKHPKLFAKKALEAADAARDLDEAKVRLSVVKAEVEMAIRTDPAEYGIGEKVTEAAIKAAMADNDRIRKAEKKVIDADHRKALLDASVRALEHKKRALEKFVDLMVAGFYSAPRASGASKKHADDMRERKAFRGRGE